MTLTQSERSDPAPSLDRLAAVPDLGEITAEQLELFAVEDLGDAIPDRLVGSYFIG